MIQVITDNRVKERAVYVELAKQFAADAVHDQGCRGMKVCVDPEETDRVVFLSQWDRKEDFLKHTQGKAFEKHIPAMAPYYISGTDTFLEIAE